MEHERLQQYFRTRLPDHPDLRLVALKRIAGGMSRETWFADVSYDGGPERDVRFTVRLDHPNGSVAPTPLRWEYEVLDKLTRTSVPAAAPLWYEDDAELVGRAPFYVRDNLPGSAAFTELFAAGADDRRTAIGRHFAELLADVHTADWETAGFGDFMRVPQTAEDCARFELEKYRHYWEANRIEPQPIVAEILSWLDRNAPTSVQRVSLVWGDVGLGNFIFEGDRITALTDWEQAHLGDPMKDWAFALWRGVDSLLPRDELFRIYAERSGLTVDEDAIAYYHPFINMMNVCTSSALIPQILDGRFDDVTFARLAMGMPFQCLVEGFPTVARSVPG